MALQKNVSKRPGFLPGRFFFARHYLEALRNTPSAVNKARQLEKPFLFRRKRSNGAAKAKQPGNNSLSSPSRLIERLRSAR